MENNQLFNRQTSQLLDRLFFNLPAIVFSLTIAIRILIAIPVGIVQIQKFEFFGENMAMLLGIATVVVLEVLLTVLSLINAQFRLKNKNMAANLLLAGIILLLMYNSYMLQSISEMYEMQYQFSALLTLHVLNIVSVTLIESIAAIEVQHKLQQAKEQNKVVIAAQTTEIKPDKIVSEIAEIISTQDTIEEKIVQLNATGYFVTQRAIAKILNVSAVKVSRTISETFKN